MTFEPLTADRRRQQTREYLLQAAAQVFAERGFHGATLDEVAAAAGFTKGAVYSNFKNKDDLFLALIETFYHREMAALYEAVDRSEVPPEARLDDFVGLIRQEVAQVPENWAALYLEFSLYAMRNPEARARLNQLEDDDIAAVAELIADGNRRMGRTPSEPPLQEARLIIALFRGVSMMRSLHPEAAGAALQEAAVAFVGRGLGVVPSE